MSFRDTIRSDATVATPSTQYLQMKKKWELPETLWGGTPAMRAAAKQYLPQEPKESKEAYENRLNRTVLLNLYKRTITTVCGIAFIKPVVVSNVPPELEYLEFNFDGVGRSITEFAYDMSVLTLHLGKCHALVDFPTVNSEGMSLGEFNEAGFRPYVTMIHPSRLIGWRSNQSLVGQELTQVRITASKMIPSEANEWADKQVNYVYVIHPNYADVYRYDREIDQTYEKEDFTENTLGKIPLVTSYSNKEDFLVATPPLEDLAYVNLCHYQSSSDQRNILHVARVPFLFGRGFQEGELENLEIGANRLVMSTNPEADIKHVEHTGQAISAGRQDLKDLEAQMGMLGADLLISKSVSRQTATARRMDQTESLSTLQLTLRSVEQAVEEAYRLAGEWLGIDASGVSVSIGDDLSVVREPNPTNALLAMLESGLMTEDQVVEEGKRQGIISSYFKLDPNRPRLSENENEQEMLQVEPILEQQEDEQDSENEE